MNKSRDTFLWLMFFNLVLFALWTLRPDEVVKTLLLQFSGALLLAFKNEIENRQPTIEVSTPPTTTTVTPANNKNQSGLNP